MRIAVGSTNPAKVQATRNVFSRILGDVDVEARDVPTGVDDQPAGDAILDGARNRALNARVDHDLGVGIEAGLLEQGDGSRFDVQYCAIVDADDRVTIGHGPGFVYPEQVYEAVDAGEEVGDVMSALSGIPEVGAKIGAIGVLTDERIDRTELTEWAVWMAAVPRIRDDLYQGDG